MVFAISFSFMIYQFIYIFTKEFCHNIFSLTERMICSYML